MYQSLHECEFYQRLLGALGEQLGRIPGRLALRFLLYILTMSPGSCLTEVYVSKRGVAQGKKQALLSTARLNDKLTVAINGQNFEGWDPTRLVARDNDSDRNGGKKRRPGQRERFGEDRSERTKRLLRGIGSA